LYQSHVLDKSSRLAPFLAILRVLKPAIRGSGRLLQWWEKLAIPVLNKLGEEKGLAVEAKNTLLSILVYDEDEEGELLEDAKATSSSVSANLFSVWLQKSLVAATDLDPDAQFIENQLEMILLAFGKKRPKDFLTTINKFFVKKDSRILSLHILTEFIRHQPPHLHQLLQTSLFENLLRCLQIDTSTRVISLAMTALIMFLPHIPSSLTPHLPALFNIYSRMLFWDRERRASVEASLDQDGEVSEKVLPIREGQWEKMPYLLESEDEVVPELLHYFTFLYGLYPLNFMDYIRKPQRYLRHAHFLGADELEVEPAEIRQRSEPYRQLHLLHPNFFTMTIESELTNNNRWMRSEAADVVAECMALFSPGDEGHPLVTRSRGPQKKLDHNSDVPEQSLLEQEAVTPYQSRHTSWRNTQSTAVAQSPDGCRTFGLHRKASQNSQSMPSIADSPSLRASDRLDSPTLPPQLVGSSQNPLHEMLNAQRSTRGSMYQSLTNDSVASLALSHNNHDNSLHVDAYLQSLTREPVPRSPSLKPGNTDPGVKVAYLHREIQLLRNDLNFERYLKQQHLSHIGQLRRKQIREARVEAETQNLINSNRSLKVKLEEARSNLLQMKKETEKSKQHSRKWEADLSAKLRSLKDEQKKWLLEREELRRDLEKQRSDAKELKDLVLSAEKRDLEKNQKMQSIELNLDELERLRAEVEKLTLTVRTYEAGESDTARAYEKAEAALRTVAVLKTQLRARDEELLKSKSAFENEIRDLMRGEGERLNGPSNRVGARVERDVIESALASSRKRVKEMKQAYTQLLRRYTQLEEKHLELKEMTDEDYKADEPLLSGSGGRARPGTAMGQSESFRTKRDEGPSPSELLAGAEPRKRNLTMGDADLPGPSVNVVRAGTLDTVIRSPSQSPTETRSPVRDGGSGSGWAGGANPTGQGFGIFHPYSPAGSAAGRSTDGDSVDAHAKPKIKPGSEIRVYGRGMFFSSFSLPS
jgi:solute carrier family 25 protein 16